MMEAAKLLSSVPGALHLRTLQSINDLSSDQSNNVVFTVPLEVMQSFSGFVNNLKKDKNGSAEGSNS